MKGPTKDITVSLMVDTVIKYLADEVVQRRTQLAAAQHALRMVRSMTVLSQLWADREAPPAVDATSSELIIQVDGKDISRIILPDDTNEDEARAMTSEDPAVVEAMQGKTLKKFIYVPGKIVNFIV